MTDYYVDPAASGLNDGTSWTNAWAGIQNAVDGANGTAPAAGDTVYCRGTEVLTIQIDIDGNSGNSNNRITWIGCNSSGNVDGTQYVLDGNNDPAVLNLFYVNKSYYDWENFIFKDSGGNGIRFISGGYNWNFINCKIYGNAGDGIYPGYLNNSKFFRCQAYDNGGYGFGPYGSTNIYYLCVAYENSGAGFYDNYSQFVHCISHDNTDGFKGGRNRIYGSISDGNSGNGIHCYGLDHSIIACSRITNNGTGIYFSNSWNVFGYNYFHDNSVVNLNPSALTLVTPNTFMADNAGIDTNIYDEDIDDGYTDRANHDFNIMPDRTYNGEIDAVIDLGFV